MKIPMAEALAEEAAQRHNSSQVAQYRAVDVLRAG
jgi:hypothetical protein